MSSVRVGFILAVSLAVGAAGCGDDVGEKPGTLDEQIAAFIPTYDLKQVEAPMSDAPDLVALGRALFFDKVLAGNRDIACATCHHPSFGTGDDLPVSIGVGGEGLGDERVLGEGRGLIPRNAPEIFNRGQVEWNTMFWDGRVNTDVADVYSTPADGDLQDGLDSVLAAQAMFPVTSDAEMRGVAGDVDVNGQANDLSMVDPADVGEIWAGLMVRLMAIEGYVTLFAAAYPGVPTEELRFSHAANAIAAFEEHAFTLVNSPWDRYLRGESGAMSEAAKRGSVLFFGDASCGACHNGKLLTDQKPHCIGAPQVGPGKGEGAPHDLGAFLVSGKEAERYAFRTPPLRNVTETGPWMHDGAYTTLEAAVRHHLDAAGALSGYDPSQLRPDFEETYAFDQAVIDEMSANLDAKLAPARALSDAEVADLMAFLDALTDPAARNLAHLVPDTVPSGLPVDH